jgi:hypothetical protein
LILEATKIAVISSYLLTVLHGHKKIDAAVTKKSGDTAP